MERGQRVTLFVSSGPELITVPDVVGLSRDSAENRITSEGLDVAIREEESDEREDEVIAQDPAGGSRVERGETVTITVSTGPRAGGRAERDRGLAWRTPAASCGGRG